jgi:RNA methyltransferase, TrmH family
VPEITSRRHPVVKTFKEAALGKDSARAVVDGWHLLDEAQSAGLPIDMVAVTDSAIGDRQPLLDALRADGVAVQSVSPEVLAALSPVQSPSGVVALIRRPTPTIDAMLDALALVLLAHDVQDPGNLGAIIRAADAGGATGVVCAGSSASPWRPKALRAAMGSSFRVPVVQCSDVLTTIATLRQAGLTIVAAVPRAGVMMHDADLRRPTAIVLGGEGRGLQEDVLAAVDIPLSIPMRPPVESLNVAVAAGLLVYEARRQRHFAANHHAVTV